MSARASSRAASRTIGAVARQFSAAWQAGEDPPDAYITVGRRRIALDVAVINRARRRLKRPARARLREDVVARRVLREIERAVHPRVPDGKTVVFTLGAPIKVPNKLVAVLATMLQAYLGSGAAEIDEKKTILGNRVRFRVVNRDSRWQAKVLGFVFTGDPSPGILIEEWQSLDDAIAAKAKTRMPQPFRGERWLALDGDWLADINTYRSVSARLAPAHTFSKILMCDGVRIDVLAER